MRLLSILLATAMLGACAGDAGEDFAATFERMQADPAFLASRVDPDFRMVEILVRGEEPEERPVPCGFEEIARHGWHVLPAASRLAETGTTYGSPEETDPATRIVTLGPAEGGADARYRFRRTDGLWRLARVDVYTHLDAGEPAPPLPCGAGTASAAGGR